MTEWLERISSRKVKSADQAKERLKLVLIHDRTTLTPQGLEALKNELLEVISRHIEIDPDVVQVFVTQEGREQRLVADIPIKTIQRRKLG